MNLSRKLQRKLVQDAIRKTLRELKRSALASHIHPKPQTPCSTRHSFGRRDDAIVVATLQRQLPLKPLCSATRLKLILKEHVPGSVFSISWNMAWHCSGNASSHILKPWWGNVNSWAAGTAVGQGLTPHPSLDSLVSRGAANHQTQGPQSLPRTGKVVRNNTHTTWKQTYSMMKPHVLVPGCS